MGHQWKIWSLTGQSLLCDGQEPWAILSCRKFKEFSHPLVFCVCVCIVHIKHSPSIIWYKAKLTVIQVLTQDLYTYFLLNNHNNTVRRCYSSLFYRLSNWIQKGLISSQSLSQEEMKLAFESTSAFSFHHNSCYSHTLHISLWSYTEQGTLKSYIN